MSTGEGQKRDISEDVTSPGDQDPASATNLDQNKRRKTAGSSSRGVANLTPEQLEKKRANDREAQRAIRERTKNTIGQLETKIR